MLEKSIEQFVDYQIECKNIKKEEKNIYRYGYQVLVEYCLNLAASILIAFSFHAVGIVVIFTIAYMAVRSYAGGYHAKTGWGCFLMSVITLISVILVIRTASRFGLDAELFVMEIILLPYIFKKVPIPIKNKPLSNNEKEYFGKMTRILYFVEVLIEAIFLIIGKPVYMLSVLAAHIIIFVLAVLDSVTRGENGGECN